MKDNIFSNVYLGKELAYLRPYICKGDPYQAKVFLIGINPATPIYPEQIEINEYLKMLENYNDFMNFYLKNRKKQNKSEISRTRMGINSLVNWIETKCNAGVVETDIFTYPTENIKKLLKMDDDILNKSIEKFWQVLLEFEPNTIILHGALTINTFKKLLREKKKDVEYFDKDENDITVVEKFSPFAKVNINSKNVDVLACRHLMYYGKSGKSFEGLRQNIKKSLENNREKRMDFDSIML